MFGWFKIPKRVVDGRAQPEWIQEANLTDVRQDLVIVVREGDSAPGRRLPDGRVVSYEIPAREKG
jgi:hypothetical protein